MTGFKFTYRLYLGSVLAGGLLALLAQPVVNWLDVVILVMTVSFFLLNFS